MLKVLSQRPLFFTKRIWEGLFIVLATVATRLWSLSGPYYVDAPRHIESILNGKLVIHPPGYIAFNATGFLVYRLFHVTADHALQMVNITFSILSASTFFCLANRLKKVSEPFLLALAYTLSPIVWFSAAIHSTYASMTFFAPLLLLCLEAEGSFLWGCLVWGMLTAFRPSDGFFLLPWMVYKATAYPLNKRLGGAAICVASIIAWWVPTALRYHMGWLGPFSTSLAQMMNLAQGVLVGGGSKHAGANIVHAILAAIVSIGLLLPWSVAGFIKCRRSPLAMSLLVYVAPGLLFFFLVYVSDAAYYAFLIAPLVLLGGIELEYYSAIVRKSILVLASVVSLLFMLFAHQSSRPSTLGALTDAYVTRYSVPSVKEHKAARLAELLGKCGSEDVKGVCK